MKIHLLNLPFKGSRWYLRGADVYRQAIPLLVAETHGVSVRRTVIKFTKFVTKQCELHVKESDDSGPKNSAASFTLFLASGSKVEGWLVETEQPVDIKVELAEKDIFEPSRIEAKTIFVNTDHAPIEVIVAYTKKLHDKLLGTDGGSWMFTGLDIQSLLSIDHLKDLRIRLEFERNGFTESRLFAGDRPLGKIIFVRVNAGE